MKQDLRIYGVEYRCWLKGKYIGKATWTDDVNIGESFIKKAINDTGEEINRVFRPDEWEFAN